MAELIDVGSAPFVSLEDAFTAEEPVRVLMYPGGQDLRPTKLIWPVENADIERPHSSEAKASDVSVYVIPNGDLAGHGASPMLDNNYVMASDLFPHYIKAFFDNDIESKYWIKNEETEVVNIDTVFSIVHYNMIYGHFLLEMMPKLFIVRNLIRSGVEGEIVLTNNTPGYVTDYIRLIVPEATIRRFDPEREHIRARRLICPGMFNSHYRFNPALNSELDGFVGRHRRDAGWFEQLSQRLGNKRKKRLFISRRHIAPSYRTMNNQLEIEEAARRLGLTPVSPEKLDIIAQIQLFSEAELIVGEFGSGMHNALFAPMGASVVCLNWISDVQSQLANLRGQRIGYILPDDNLPRTFHFEQETAAFTINPKTFSDRVGALIGDLH